MDLPVKNETCPLCGERGQVYFSDHNHLFFTCPNCHGLFRDQDQWPDSQSEKERYLLHQNHMQDKGYQAFAGPILNAVRSDFDEGSFGLDYGCGHTPVISEILRQENFKVEDYDPLFYPEKVFEGKAYDYVICCEVIEHFHHPNREFALLNKLLNQNGRLICMTDIYSDKIDFSRWYYKNDPTHVFIYREQTFRYICSQSNFRDVKIEGRLIQFLK